MTWSSDSVGVNCIELVGDDTDPDAVPSAPPMFDDILPIVLNAEPIVAAPLIDDGLYVGIGWNGLRDCVTGSGLNSTRDSDKMTLAIEIFLLQITWEKSEKSLYELT